jgi:hypothetical protein
MDQQEQCKMMLETAQRALLCTACCFYICLLKQNLPSCSSYGR